MILKVQNWENTNLNLFKQAIDNSNGNFTQSNLVSNGLLANSSDLVDELGFYKNDQTFRGSVMFYNDYMNNYTDNFYRHSFQHSRLNEYSRRFSNPSENLKLSADNDSTKGYTEEFKTTTTIRALFILKIHSKLLSCLLIALFSAFVLNRLNRVESLIQMDFERFMHDNLQYKKRFLLQDI